jgi:hypothetical protein
MLVPSLERQAAIKADARRFRTLCNAAMAYADAGQGEIATAVLNVLMQAPTEAHPEEAEWAIENAVRRIKDKEIEKREAERDEEEIK